jgi:hypothetical protein
VGLAAFAAFAHQTLHQLVRADAGQHAALTQRLLGLRDPGELYQVPWPRCRWWMKVKLWIFGVLDVKAN